MDRGLGLTGEHLSKGLGELARVLTWPLSQDCLGQPNNGNHVDGRIAALFCVLACARHLVS